MSLNIAIGTSLRNPISPGPPVNAVPITIENGTEFLEKLYQTLKLCEKKRIPEAGAQRLADRLDLVNLRCCLSVDELGT